MLMFHVYIISLLFYLFHNCCIIKYLLSSIVIMTKFAFIFKFYILYKSYICIITIVLMNHTFLYILTFSRALVVSYCLFRALFSQLQAYFNISFKANIGGGKLAQLIFLEQFLFLLHFQSTFVECSILDWKFSFSLFLQLKLSPHPLIAYEASSEKIASDLLSIILYVVSCFSFAASNNVVSLLG